MRVLPADAVLGATVQGVDLRALDSETFAAVHRAWLDYQVLLFRDQGLTDEDLAAFSRRFGDLDNAPVQETGRRFVEGHPEIYVISNVVQNGLAIRVRSLTATLRPFTSVSSMPQTGRR